MKRQKFARFWTIGAIAALTGLAGCEMAPAFEPAAPAPVAEVPETAPSPDDEVDLQNMLSVAGAADIRHGTQQYQAPSGTPQDEREERIFVAFLSSAQEVPAVRSKAEGAMAFILNKQQDRLRFVLQHNVAEATVAHLHIGSAGENGPVAVALPEVHKISVGSLKLTREQAKQLLAGRVYVNVHSQSNPMGEIRGQILRPGETVFVAALRGAEEVPTNQSAATGLATLILSPSRTEVRYRVTATGLSPTAAHVHRGIAGSNGPVAFPFAAAVDGVSEGKFPVTAADVQALALRAFYVNLHSAQHPMGEIRGQVVRPGEAVFAANLSGAQEVPAVAGASKGNAMIVLGSGGAKFLYVVKTDAPATVAHIHKAPGGSNGPVELPLEPVGAEMSGILDLGDARRADVERGLWYVNVHTAANPKGEIRGQLLRPGETLFTAALAGNNEVPASPSTATGAVAVILNAARTEVRYDGNVTGVVPTAAHIHAAPAGGNGPVVLPLIFTGTAIAGSAAVTPDFVSKLGSAGLYVNVHSAQNPMGDVRGQLLVPGAAAVAVTTPTTAATMQPAPTTPPAPPHDHTH